MLLLIFIYIMCGASIDLETLICGQRVMPQLPMTAKHLLWEQQSWLQWMQVRALYPDIALLFAFCWTCFSLAARLHFISPLLTPALVSYIYIINNLILRRHNCSKVNLGFFLHYFVSYEIASAIIHNRIYEKKCLSLPN